MAQLVRALLCNLGHDKELDDDGTKQTNTLLIYNMLIYVNDIETASLVSDTYSIFSFPFDPASSVC